MKTCNTQYESLIAERIRHHLGCPPERLIPVPTYPDSIVYEAQSPRYHVIFKMHDPSGHDPDNVGLEAWTCTKVRSLGVPAPHVLAVDTTRSHLPGSYFIMEQAAGTPLSELDLPVERHQPLVREIGRCLRLIHAVELAGFGTLDEAHFRRTGTVRGREETWRAAVLVQVPSSLRYLEQAGAIDRTTIDAVQRWIDGYGELLDAVGASCLLHGDLGSLHVWVDAEREAITSFIEIVSNYVLEHLFCGIGELSPDTERISC
jgi:hypothetical protein